MTQSGHVTVPREVETALARYPDLVDPRVEVLAGGLLHASYSVETGAGRFILQRVNSVFSPRIHDNMDAITRRLGERGVETFRLMRTTEGALFADLAEGGRWRLLTRIEGQTFEACEGLAQARGAARAVAAFHSALEDFGDELHPLGFPYHDTKLHLRDLEAALAKGTQHRLHAEVAELAAALLSTASRWRDDSDLPRRVIHGDLKISNVLFAPEDPSGERATDSIEPGSDARALVDLDTVSRLPLYYDLGDAWRSWCNTGGDCDAVLDLALYRASAEAYLSATRLALGRDELDSLAEGLERISLELCARFVADALQESYFGWDAVRFETAGDHNLARARGQWSLHQQACETREERRRFLLG